LPQELPADLKSVPRAPEEARWLVEDLCESIRHDLKKQAAYLEKAVAVESELNLPAICARIEDLGEKDTFAFEERSFLSQNVELDSIIVSVPNSDSHKVKTPEEKHFTIKYGETGHTYESLIGDYLDNVKTVTIEDPYIRITHQIANFVRFCEALVKLGNVKKIVLITGYDEETPVMEVPEKLTVIKQSLLEVDIFLDIQFNDKIHDREIRFDNGWTIKIGRGLDFYQKPNDWFEIGANDLSLRKCLETKVDIFRSNHNQLS
jgi:ATP-dependent Lon protease